TVSARLEAQGVESFTPGEALAVLERLLRGESTQVGVLRLDWLRWAQSSGRTPIPPRFAELGREARKEEEASAGGGLRLDRRRLLALAPEERRSRLAAYLCDQVGRVLGLPAAQVDVTRPVGKLGLDSLMAVELKNRIEADLGVGPTVVALLDGPDVTTLTTQVLSELEGSRGRRAPDVDTVVIRARPRPGELPLSPAQRWMWCLHELDPENPWCNVPIALRIAGPLDVEAIELSLNEVVRRHEVLRTRVLTLEDRPMPSIAAHEPFALAITDLSGLPA